jgi:hypothetical protein
MLADGITAVGTDKNGHRRPRVMPGPGIAPWLQRSMGLRIRELSLASAVLVPFWRAA